MKSWGFPITIFYALVVAALLAPGVFMLAGETSWSEGMEVYGEWWFIWVWVVILVGGQAMLLFVSVDTSWRRTKPREHVWFSAGIGIALFGLLTVVALWALVGAIGGDDSLPWTLGDDDLEGVVPLAWLFGLWLLWGVVFYLYLKKHSLAVERLVGWLLKGSVLELLIAVPCHVIVRRREDCSAPILTGYGICTGIAIMLLCFGPGVLFLYKRRMQRYER